MGSDVVLGPVAANNRRVGGKAANIHAVIGIGSDVVLGPVAANNHRVGGKAVHPTFLQIAIQAVNLLHLLSK